MHIDDNFSKMLYVIKTLNEKNIYQNISKTIINQYLYILNSREIVDCDFSLFHFGIHSEKIDNYLLFSEKIGAIETRWLTAKGYSFKTLPDTDKYAACISSETIREIDLIIDQYTKFNLDELSIITVAMIIKEKYNAPNDNSIIQSVGSLLRGQSAKKIEELLGNLKVISINKNNEPHSSASNA